MVTLLSKDGSKVLARVDKDYINTGEDGIHSRVGLEWSENEVKQETWFDFPDIEFEEKITRFRCKDDDGEIYYGGWLYNDGACIMQQIVLSWTMRDAGCTTIEIKNDDKDWVLEIG